jgi:hypothetical protein
VKSLAGGAMWQCEIDMGVLSPSETGAVVAKIEDLKGNIKP